ncbi:MAG: DUF3179 domain-containing protein [Rhizobiaceae bacterium]
MKPAILMALIALIVPFSAAFAQVERWKSEGWKTDFSKTNIQLSEVMSGGPPRDGIPPIDDPKFIDVAAVTDLADQDPVIGLVINGDARAYPLRIMTWHEIVNDKVGGTPVAVTYCPLCNAAIVFDAHVNGKELTFGTTGKLRKSDLIMYDRATNSWWQQFVGESIAGTYTGQKLALVPVRLESWKEFRQRHPQGKVLVPNNADLRDYGRNPYENYDISARPFLYSGSMPDGIEPMSRVVVVRRGNEQPLILSLELLRRSSSLKMDGYQLNWVAGQASALHDRTITNGRDVGTVTVLRESDGKHVPYDVTFAFVAHAFHPEIPIKQQ